MYNDNLKIKKTRTKISLSVKEYNEMKEAQEWCKKNGYVGFVKWYDAKLAECAQRGTLPIEASEYEALIDDAKYNLRFVY